MAGLVVVDASLAVKWGVPEPYTEQAFELAETWANDGTQLIAPCLILAEITNALYKRVKRGEMDSTTARHALHIVLNFGVEIREEPGLPGRVLELAHELKMSATYDAHYLVLAEEVGCDLWTGDRRLYHLAKKRFSWVKWVGEV
jgi:predicted nucleic acid-binding protein